MEDAQRFQNTLEMAPVLTIAAMQLIARKMSHLQSRQQQEVQGLDCFQFGKMGPKVPVLFLSGAMDCRILTNRQTLIVVLTDRQTDRLFYSSIDFTM